MWRLWFVSLTICIATWVGAQPQVKVEGTLNGYFLASDGTLAVREVPFTFPSELASSDLPDCLYVLWAGYYLKAKFASEKPIQSVWLLASNGRLLWRRHYPEGVTEETIPYQYGGWVGVKGQDGLSIRLLIRFVDGSEMLVRPHFPTRFERVLPLKVDWLDFIRIAEVDNLLKAKGKEIWEGFSLDGIPFLLEGDEGQQVLINHPKPPKGFVRYKGPLPKVPFGMKVHVGEVRGEERRHEEFGGWLEKINGVWTAVLRYFPNWWVLKDCAPPNYTVYREPDAIYRLETIIHEAFHVWWFQRVKSPKVEGKERMTQNFFARIVEREALARALEAENDSEKRLWTKAFLVQRGKRRLSEEANLEQILFERWEETVEGVATFVGRQALAIAEVDYQPIAEMKTDQEFSGYSTSTLSGQELANWIRSNPQFLGLAQAFLISQWDKEWSRKVEAGVSLEELLDEAVKDVELSSDFLFPLEEQLTKTLEKAVSKQLHSKPPDPSITLWIYPPPEALTEVFEVLKQLKEELGVPLPKLTFSLPKGMVIKESPTWVVLDEPHKRFGILWDANKQLVAVYYPGGTTTLRGEQLKVHGNWQISWDSTGVHLHPVEEEQKSKGGALKMKLKKAWSSIALPIIFLVTAGHLNALQETQETPEEIAITGTWSGVFYSSVTGQFQYAEFPIDAPEVGNYYFIDEEEVTLNLSVFRWEGSDLHRTDATFYIAFSFSTNDWRNWQFQGVGVGWQPRVRSGPQSGRDKVSTKVIFKPDGSVEIEVTITKPDGSTHTFVIQSPSAPPPGTVLFTSVLGDAEKLPYAEAMNGRCVAEAEIWRKGKPQKKHRILCQPQTTIPLPPANDYTGRAMRVILSKGPDNSACLGPVAPNPGPPFDVRPNVNQYVVFVFWQHKGIKGRVRVETSEIKDPVSRVAEVCLTRKVKEGEDPDFEIVESDGSRTGYKVLSKAYADRNIQRGRNWVEAEFLVPYPDPNGGLYDLFVFLITDSFPIPSNYHWEPKYGREVVSVPTCEYSRPRRDTEEGHDSFNACSQSIPKDMKLVVTFRPVKGGDDGIENPTPSN